MTTDSQASNCSPGKPRPQDQPPEQRDSGGPGRGLGHGSRTTWVGPESLAPDSAAVRLWTGVPTGDTAHWGEGADLRCVPSAEMPGSSDRNATGENLVSVVSLTGAPEKFTVLTLGVYGDHQEGRERGRH